MPPERRRPTTLALELAIAIGLVFGSWSLGRLLSSAGAPGAETTLEIPAGRRALAPPLASRGLIVLIDAGADLPVAEPALTTSLERLRSRGIGLRLPASPDPTTALLRGGTGRRASSGGLRALEDRDARVVLASGGDPAYPERLARPRDVELPEEVPGHWMGSLSEDDRRAMRSAIADLEDAPVRLVVVRLRSLARYRTSATRDGASRRLAERGHVAQALDIGLDELLVRAGSSTLAAVVYLPGPEDAAAEVGLAAPGLLYREGRPEARVDDLVVTISALLGMCPPPGCRASARRPELDWTEDEARRFEEVWIAQRTADER
ncbi:MAG: hypothetical protein R3F20_15965 [Planctomycetota bacterium]